MIRNIIRRNEKGNSVIEFAITLPILILVIFGIIHFGRAIMTTNILTTAAREGARKAAVALPGDSTSVYDKVNEVLAAGRVRNGHTLITYDLTNKTVRVDVSTYFTVIGHNMTRLPAFLGGGAACPDSIPLQGSTVMKYER